MIPKEHLKQLPITQIPTDYPRDSKKVALSIPLFHSTKGYTVNFNEDNEFDIETFKDIFCKGAVWAAISIMTNTDLCEKGMPIYFHVQDKIYDEVMSVFEQFDVPEEWVHQTTFKEAETQLLHYNTGRKLGGLCDDKIDTDVLFIWDADALVYRSPGDPIIEWYQHFEDVLADTLMTSFYSEYNGGDLSFVNWLLRGIGIRELPETVTTEEMRLAEHRVYKKAELPVPNQQFRYGAAMFAVPLKHPVVPFLQRWHEESYTEEALFSIWMNAVGCPFVEFEKLFLPFKRTDDEFIEYHGSCIAHPLGQTEKLPQYIERLKRGIDGRNWDYSVAPRTNDSITQHVICLAHNPAHKEFSHCAFAQKARKLAWMGMYSGHQTFFYGNELSYIPPEDRNPDMKYDGVECTDFIECTTEEDLISQFGDYRAVYKQNHVWSPDQMIYKIFDAKCEHEIRKRFKPGDIICYTFGPGQRRLYNALQDLQGIHMESGIGYYNPYMKYKVFESPSLMNFNYGIYEQKYQGVKHITDEEEKKQIDWNTHVHHSWMQWQDTVIPNSFDLEDFDFRVDKEDYLFYLGRIMPGKGVEEAMRIADATGRKLLVAGQGDFEERMGFKPWDCVELLDVIGVEERRVLLSKAHALLCLSKYPEPFGGVFAEAMLSGTVPVATRMGAFMDYIDHGVNGLILGLNILDQGIYAVEELVPKIDPYQVRAKGLRFINQVVARQYAEYFGSISEMWLNGGKPYWLINTDRTELDWTHQHASINWKEYGLDEKELMTPIAA